MGYDYDPNETFNEYPETGKQVRIIIGQNEEAISSKGNPMMVMECAVAEGYTGAGFKSKFYLMPFLTAHVMNATGIDPDIPIHVDDMTFRGRDAAVIFKAEEYPKKDGSKGTATKIDKWVPRDKATIKLSADPANAANEEQFGSEGEPAADEDEIPFK